MGRELEYVSRVLGSTKWAGDGGFTDLCAQEIQARLGVSSALLTHSCTAALEMAAILCRLEPGDEVIMPSFTFVSTANAVALRGAVPVFVDIRPDTLNLDEALIEAAITSRTRAIMVVHYAGVCCAMDEINALAARHGLVVIEDAAHAYLSTYRGRQAGSLGRMAAISFHETKNVISGEGGVFATSDPELAARAQIIREKGTDRSRFLRGEVKQYSWVDIGSSYLPSELIAAVLYAQLQVASEITAQRVALWNRYDARFEAAEAAGLARRPVTPPECVHNGHIFYLLLESHARRTSLTRLLASQGISAASHYVPLHSSEAGRRFGRASGELKVTDDCAGRLVRLPLHVQMTPAEIDQVADVVEAALAA